ncbi:MULTISPECIES: hypothetical protein [Haloferax]|uniref:Uncharacterized protein n=1 Tax=Haloferax massiliensis TaxID=1476858 RepID=A0A0D6JTR0_9EURY|nr:MULTISPECIES: hypothetical protein [Haloferax]MDS0242023.1 hypothetical protein [Haloferax sp. S2CR25]MDS0445144.1 hypothetical protein [Haloferax sp. S2CR25-2]CQR51008.1 hypothetical protein BN996_02494 [Haloferax massiliensis]
MAIVAEILLRSELLPLVGLARSLPNREVSLSQLIRLDDARHLLMVSVEPEAKAAFEAEVDAQPEVADVGSSRIFAARSARSTRHHALQLPQWYRTYRHRCVARRACDIYRTPPAKVIARR